MALSRISVLGCGWLGLALAEDLIDKGYKVKGSTTTESKLNGFLEKGINPYYINLTPIVQATDIKGFMDTELVIINIPPGTRTRSVLFHVEQIQQLIPYLEKSSAKYILYISSTSIYPNTNGEVKENDVMEVFQAENKTLATAEKMIREIPGKEVTVLRCGGLTGYDRLLIRHFAGRKNLTIGEEPVNLIHRDDVIGIIEAVIKQEKWGETYNICSPFHPLKKDFYKELAERFEYDQPEFVTSDLQPFKIVNTEKLDRELNYAFKYPDPMKYVY
ncbi:MAG TPA: NAD(P)-binding domain-containing protein [Cytophagaceae bacterium]|nr:NAD(P)-binding domain-containing protein [Cytophagaceae bacterium]